MPEPSPDERGPDKRVAAGRAGPEPRQWSRRFLTLVADLGLTESLRAGRYLARAGAVVSLRRSGNLVVALVRDEDEKVHKARIAFGRLAGGDWSRIERALGARAGYAASLLVGTVPADLDEVVAGLGLSLLPTGNDDLAMDCSCDDWRRPCAHAAAACHELARHLERDPFELLALRGRERDVLLDGVRTYWSAPAEAREPTPGRPPWPDGPAPDSELPSDAEEFWARPSAPELSARVPSAQVPSDLVPSDLAEPVPREAGSILDEYGPLAVGASGDLRDRLRPAYQRFADGSR